MRIGFYGGMANDMYMMAQALAGQGLDVRFVRDRSNHDALSQPSWQDAPMVLTEAQARASASWSWEHWAALERDSGWQAPQWLVDPLVSSLPGAAPQGACGMDALFLRAMLARRPHLARALHLLRECDFIVANTVEGATLALVSGRPYLLWPHGSDVRFAAGLERPKGGGLRGAVENYFWGRLIRAAYSRAEAVGSHDPKASGGQMGNALGFVPRERIEFLPLPIAALDVPQGRAARRERLARFCAQAGVPVPESELVFVIPSRVDFFWKGHDRFFRALAATPAAQRCQVLVTGWGRDAQAAQGLVAGGPMAQRVTFLPVIASKPVLYDLLMGADLVVDQFNIGGYGAAALEAMACGAPVMIWLDEAVFAGHGFPVPPVLNVRDEASIAGALADTFSGAVDLESVGRKGLAWVCEHHGAAPVAQRLRQLVHGWLQDGPQTGPGLGGRL